MEGRTRLELLLPIDFFILETLSWVALLLYSWLRFGFFFPCLSLDTTPHNE